jgi:hypothetical protein
MEIENQLESVLRPSNIKNRVAEPEPELEPEYQSFGYGSRLRVSLGILKNSY